VLADRGALSIGVTSKSTSLRGHAGREAGKAFGWASKGDLFDNGKIAERLGAYTTGDIVGLGYNEGAESVFWTKNGRLVQTIRPVPRSFGELVPTITIEGAGSAARFNYIGDFEFKQKEEGRAGERRRVALNPLPPSLVKGGSSSRSMAMTARSPKAEQDLLGPHLRCRCHKRVKLMRDKCSFTEFSKLERSSILQPRALGTDLASPEPACSRLADYIIVQAFPHCNQLEMKLLLVILCRCVVLKRRPTLPSGRACGRFRAGSVTEDSNRVRRVQMWLTLSAQWFTLRSYHMIKPVLMSMWVWQSVGRAGGCPLRSLRAVRYCL
jgi:hypothetical protein